MKMREPTDQIRCQMLERGMSEGDIADFLANVALIGAQSGYVPLEKVGIPDPSLLLDYKLLHQDTPEPDKRAKNLLDRTVVIKLNGGRSTTMGGSVPKGVLTAKRGLSYLEVAINQVKGLRQQWDCRSPLLLMNSFFTEHPTREVLGRLAFPVLTFEQNEVPRLVEDTLRPLDTGTDEDWAPPGHGDIYQSLARRGFLDGLRSQGYKWAFISNIDNLAATVDPRILLLIEREGADFLLEVTPRTEADRKGGALVERNGRLELLEIAQVHPDQRELFMDIDRFPVFNTNNIWVDLDAVAERLAAGPLGLPLIQNRKRVQGVNVIQLETAMGAAIGLFPRARGLKVNRDRFCPTKKIGDLFALRSDACLLDSMANLVRNPKRPPTLPLMPSVHFDNDFIDSPLRINERFEDPSSVSLLRAEVFKVSGNVYFERDVIIEGKVEISAQQRETYRVPKGAVLADRNYP